MSLAAVMWARDLTLGGVLTARPLWCRSEVGASFDLVVCSEVVEHVSDLKLMVKDLSALLRPGGGMMITTINRCVCAAVPGRHGARCALSLLSFMIFRDDSTP